MTAANQGETQGRDGAIATALARFPEIAAAWLFGSYARGEARADSDLDIGVTELERLLLAALDRG